MCHNKSFLVFYDDVTMYIRNEHGNLNEHELNSAFDWPHILVSML